MVVYTIDRVLVKAPLCAFAENTEQKSCAEIHTVSGARQVLFDFQESHLSAVFFMHMKV